MFFLTDPPATGALRTLSGPNPGARALHECCLQLALEHV